MKKSIWTKYGNLIGLAILTLLVLFVGWFETVQPGGTDFADLTGGIITFDTVTRIGILTIVVVGLNLLMGYAGQISLGQAAFYGMGAYASAILVTRIDLLGLPSGLNEAWWWPWLVMVGAMFLTGGFAYLVGRPILQLKGHYLAMATLGLGIMVNILFRENFGFKINNLDLTGGFDGIHSIPRLSISGFEIWPIERYYYLVWLVAILAIALAINIVHSRVGRAFRAIHGSELAAETMGIDTARFKVLALVISAMYASLAGSLYAHFQAAVSPTPFGFGSSLELVVMAAVGGMSTIWGAAFGVAFIFGLKELLRSRLHLLLEGAGGEHEIIAFGVILVVIMIFMPDGLVLGTRRLYHNWRHRQPLSESGTEAVPRSAS
jgi:branched-chain amino acid transport system permease protein